MRTQYPQSVFVPIMSSYELLIILQHLREELQVTHDAITARMEIEKERERNAGDDEEIAVEQKDSSAIQPKEKADESALAAVTADETEGNPKRGRATV